MHFDFTGRSVLVTGGTSGIGLAVARAFAVRDGLIAAGIAADRVVLEKPMQTEANISGEDPRARRVDVAVR